ncbi:hypothetical protein GBF35_36170 [Nonomuraea phyllanthi]|uniref:hypothetical protein n=1 Tax=Nonomuraea phyllanthi TaxID=2219224 RepID=UPI001292D117|nr:hypothetical protein [Nonomuraea phyllanthi]QFY11302.1 hypothetical protein GBF35_36170 [Nonomuraea phyllanthi]
MSEVVPLPSFGEVFFDARGQERCLRVTWHEGTLVLSLWRGEMCTASFRMPMEDVGRLLDTLDEGYAEATGEQPAVPAHDPATEAIPGTGQYHRPPEHVQPPAAPQRQPDERPTAALSPSDVLVARGAPAAHQDKLVASYGETTAPRDAVPQSAAPQAYGDPAPAYAEPSPFTGPQYVETTAPQQRYTGDPFSGPQYTAESPQYGGHAQGEPFTGPQYVEAPYADGQYADSGPVYQMPGDQPAAEPRRQSPLSTDPLGFPSQANPPHQPSHHRADQHRADRADQHRADQYGNDQYGNDQYPSDPYPSDAFARRPEQYQQAQQSQGTAGLGTPMHGIPGAGRPRPEPRPVHDDYGSYQQGRPNPVDPLLSMGRQEQQQPDPLSRPYVGDPMFSTGERLRPEQQPDYHERSDRREW